jgi:outer membrane lipoprotein carrier protein
MKHSTVKQSKFNFFRFKAVLKISLICFLAFSFTGNKLQKDPKATEILNKLSAKTKAYTSIQADFTYTVKSADVNETQKGKLLVKGDKYKYTIFGVTKVCDGKKICTISAADEEIVINNVKFNDPDEFSPKEIFTIYQKGYKYRYIKEVPINKKPHHLIELYPEVDNKNPYKKIVMYIDKATTEVNKVEFFHKTSAKVFTIVMNKAIFNQVIADTIFFCGCGIKKDYDCDDQTKAK